MSIMSICIVDTRHQLYECLRNNGYGRKGTGDRYVLLRHGGFTELVHFMPFMDSFFESPCCLASYTFEGNPAEYVKEYVNSMYDMDGEAGDGYEDAFKYEMSMIRDGVHYSIENFQTSPYLGMPCEIIRIMDEQEALDWLVAEQREKSSGAEAGDGMDEGGTDG